MTEKLLGYGPQGLALEVNPWQTKSSTEAVLLYRGAIVAGWANVETSLIEVAIRASAHPAYQGHRDSFPSKLKSRIAYLEEVLALPGPLLPFRSLGEAVLRRFRETADLRNLMAHAAMKVLPDWGATFRIFRAKSAHEITYGTRRLTQKELEELARKATRYSRAVRLLVAQIDGRELLPPLDAEQAV